MQTLGKSDQRIPALDDDTLFIGYAFRKGNCVTVEGTPYVVVGPLGKGSVGDVYEVKDLTTGKHFAMKHLYFQFTTGKAYKYYIKLRLLASQKSPHPCFVWPIAAEFDERTQSCLYILPLVPKDYQPLAVAIIRGSLTLEQRLSICRQVAEAFSKLHQNRDWVYGDCSTKNILFKASRRGKPKVLIIDCDTVTPEKAPFGLEGSGCFRAPEVLLGQPPTQNSDVHSIAAVLFQLLIGCNPLDGTRTRSQPFSEKTVQEYYGRTPQYIFDPSCANKPLHPDLAARMAALPEGLMVYFRLVFSQNRLLGRTPRPGPDVLLNSLPK